MPDRKVGFFNKPQNLRIKLKGFILVVDKDAGQVDLDRAADLLRQLIGLTADYKNRARTAMQRLGLACLRRGPADQALELAIALEALVVDSPGEHTFKIALRAAILTSTELESRRRRRAIIEAMYKIRSSLMHSGHFQRNLQSPRLRRPSNHRNRI